MAAEFASAQRHGPLLCVFAKAPRPGEVKTRLAVRCGAATAAHIAAALVEHTVSIAHRHWPGPVQLWVWPDRDHPCFAELAARYEMPVVLQRGADLGERMYGALCAGVAKHGAAAILGGDVPQIDSAILGGAFGALQARRNVIGPSADGGFYLLGTCTVRPRMFTGLRWGHDKVYGDTVTHCRTLGISFDTNLPPLRDVDTWDDLIAAARTVPSLRHFTEDHDTNNHGGNQTQPR